MLLWFFPVAEPAGIANIGVIEELQKRGYQITSIAGTSMGALVGMYSAGKLEEYKNSSY
jgi:NTE family protein